MSNKIIMGIFIFGLMLRIAFLNSIPAGFTPDEASFGYDAYSIIHTGSDQWGNIMPLTLKSFGDYKMPLYAYLSIPNILLFGLNEFSTRLLNVLLGSLAIVVTYLLTKKLTQNENVSLLAALMLAISPWHIPMSRGAFEANLTTFFMPLMLLLIIKAKKNPKYLYWAVLAGGLNIFTYHAARLITPIIFLVGIVFYLDISKSNLKKYAKQFALFSVFFTLAAYTYLNGAGSRAATVGIFSILGDAGNKRYEAVILGIPDIIARVFNNKVIYFFQVFSSNYLSYFSPQFLFNHGPAESTYGMVPGRGVLYLFEILALLGFLFWLARTKIEKTYHPILIWLFAAPIPAALTIGPGYAANRAIIMLPALTICSAIGLYFVYEQLSKLKFLSPNLVKTGIAFTIMISFLNFSEDYYIHQQATGAPAMIYGVKQALTQTQGSSRIVISKKISEPHIYVAFYNQINPKNYQQAINSWGFDEGDYNWVDQIPDYSLGKYEFKLIDWEFEKLQSDSLLVGVPEEFKENTVIKNKIYYPNNNQAIFIVSTDDN